MAASWIVLDIESYRTRNERVIAALAEEALNAKPCRNAPKADKERWNSPESRKKRVDDAIEKTAVDPLLAEPLIVCVSVDEETSEFTAWDGTIRDLMERFAATVARRCNKDTVWAGHNIGGYDLPLLVTWWQRLGMRVPESFPVPMAGGKWRGRIFDTMRRIPTKTGFISADQACSAFDIPCKTVMWKGEPMVGSRVIEAYDAGECGVIAEYCRQDVRAETALFLRLTCGGAWGLWERSDMTAEQLREIAESDLSAAQKWLSAMPLLQSAGLLFGVAP